MIAIVGVGAIGGVCAAPLAAARDDVVCCVRRPFDRLVVEHPAAQTLARPRVETDPAVVGPATWVLLATKAHQIEGAAAWLDATVGPETRVAVLQNGVEHRDRVRRWAPSERVVPVVVMCPATALVPGRIVQRRDARLVVPDAATGRDFAALFDGTGDHLVVETTADFDRAAWRKLAFNVASGAIAALAGRPVAEIAHPRRGELARALVLECLAVAAAEGATLPASLADEIARGIESGRIGGAPSTLTDRLAGRPLEVDARNGAVVRLGARHRIPTPVNALACERMTDLHRSAGGDHLDALCAALP